MQCSTFVGFPAFDVWEGVVAVSVAWPPCPVRSERGCVVYWLLPFIMRVVTDVYPVCSVGPSSREVSWDGEVDSLSSGETGNTTGAALIRYLGFRLPKGSWEGGTLCPSRPQKVIMWQGGRIPGTSGSRLCHDAFCCEQPLRGLHSVRAFFV